MSTIFEQPAASKTAGNSHFVRFYDIDAQLLDEVAEFIAAALETGGCGIVIATPEHVLDLRRRLASQGAPGSQLDYSSANLITLDAEATLAQIMVDNWPDEYQFNQVVGSVVRKACASGATVNAFGEMVALLCARGLHGAAIRLEQLWNGLADEAAFSLFCAYPWKLFPTAELAEAFESVCGQHRHACLQHQTPPSDSVAHEQFRLAKVEQQARALVAEVARRKEAEEAVKRKEREFADFVENAAEGLHQVGADGIILWANKAELAMLGYRWEEYIGRHISEFHIDPLVISSVLSKLQSGATIHDQPARLRCSDGTIKHVLISSNGCFENGQLRNTRCFTRDATERHQRDEALSQRDRVLLNAPVASALLAGPDFTFVLANKRYCEMMSRSEFEGRTFLEVFPELKDSEVARQLQQVYDTAQPFTAEELRMVVNRPDGTPEERFFKCSLEPLTGVDGMDQGIIVVAVDISEHVRCRVKFEQAQLERETLLAELTKANRAKDEFLAMLGHELRNPLSPIVNALALMRLRDSGESRHEQQIIRRQVDHLVRLVDDLLDISRITSGKIDLKIEAVDMAMVLGKACEMVSPLIEQRGHQLSVAIEPGLSVFEGDAIRLAQVVSNLLTNAARYTDPGGKIALSAARDEAGFICISVKDNGTGIQADLLAQVFELFFQGKRGVDRREGGLGIGLALVKNIVELHGGSVQAKSAGPGQGSEFIVRLPASVLSQTQGQRGNAHLAECEPASGKLRIMVIDDNVDAADTMGRFLAMNGHAVEVFNDPVAALRAVPRFMPEIAVLDIGLPGMDGYELAVRMRAHMEAQPCRLIALTGYGQEADREKSRAAGIERHFVKPVNPNALAACINELAAV